MTRFIKQFNFMKGTLVFALVAGLLFAACNKDDSDPVPPADKTALQDSVNAAQALYDGAVEGTKPGEYEAGSKAAFKTVIDAANAVLADPNATQSAVTNATAQLAAAMATFQTHLIKEIAAENLVGFWKMNGNTVDSSGNEHDGTLTAGHAYFGAGTPTLTADRFGRANMAYHFDQGGNINVPYSSALNPQEMTISVWVKKEAPATRTINTDTYTILSLNRWNGYKFQLQGANKFFFTVKAVNGTDTAYYDRDDETAVLDNDTWYHGVVTFKAGEMNFYVNGDLVKSWTNTPNAPITLTDPIDFVIGQDLPTDKYSTTDGDPNFVNWGGFWTGDLDDVMFYNVALDATQVKSIYNNQKDL
jgi:hypothetical protein